MRALVYTRAGGPDVLQVEEWPDPVPKGNEVLVRVKRAGLNFSDLAARVGLYPDAPKFPFVSGYEVSGVVEALGDGARRVKVGERVVAMVRFGAQATHVIVPESQLRTIPASVSFDAAAALPVNYVTAFHMLFHLAPLKPGMKVLIHMAAGGVGLSAIQLARTVPDVELFGTASASKHDFLRKAGLHHPIDYHSVDYVAEVRRLTGGHGVHRVLDALGGPDWHKGYSLLRPAGHLLAFGWANMVDGERRSLLTVARQFLQLKRYSPMQLMDQNRSVSGVNLGHMWDELELLGGHLDTLLEWADQGVVAPQIDSVFPLAKAAEAHQHVAARKNVGKVLFDCD